MGQCLQKKARGWTPADPPKGVSVLLGCQLQVLLPFNISSPEASCPGMPVLLSSSHQEYATLIGV